MAIKLSSAIKVVSVYYGYVGIFENQVPYNISEYPYVAYTFHTGRNKPMKNQEVFFGSFEYAERHLNYYVEAGNASREMDLDRHRKSDVDRQSIVK